jgi:membrane-bound metal-dependent hydrolase YbcI (DUF457 family)
MNEIFHSVVDFINTASVARAIAFALIASFALTQGIKYTLPDFLTDASHRTMTVLLAYAIAFWVCWAMWPPLAPNRLVLSVVTGLCTPLFYKVVTAVLYKYAPWLESYLSARPKEKQP